MEAAITYTPDNLSDDSIDEYWESLTDEEKADFAASLEEGRRAFENGECYDFDEVFAELEARFCADE